MDKKQAEKHGEVIKWHCNNIDKGVWYKCERHEWVLVYSPSFSIDCKYVQNDEYAELRKAQAHGKIIQILVDDNHDHSGEPYWVDTKHIQYCGKYRIKPEDSSFKVGDWVKWNNKKVFKVTSIDTSWDESEELQLFDGTWDYRHDEPNGYYADECKLWQPTDGEWVVAEDYESSFHVFKYSNEYKHIKEVEPFIGKLPSFIKDKE